MVNAWDNNIVKVTPKSTALFHYFSPMQFDPENPVNKLCAQGMMLEGEAKPTEAAALFAQAWAIAANPVEKFTAAHYVARHQNSIADKLHWDEIALQNALEMHNPEIKQVYPSLYLNVAKCHED